MQTFYRLLAAIYTFYMPRFHCLGNGYLIYRRLWLLRVWKTHALCILQNDFVLPFFFFLTYVDISSMADSLPFCNKRTSSHRSFQSLHALKISSFLLSLWFVSSLSEDLWDSKLVIEVFHFLPKFFIKVKTAQFENIFPFSFTIPK